MEDSNIQAISTPEQLNIKLKDEVFIREFSNYVIFEGMSKPKAWSKTFGVEHPLDPNMTTKMYRWLKKPEVQRWLKKANSSLEVDWIDKRVNALQHLYDIGMADENKINVDALDKFLGHLNREENKIKLDIGNGNQINIVQIVQEKLNSITSGATIQPNGMVGVKAIPNNNYTMPNHRAEEALEAILAKSNK